MRVLLSIAFVSSLFATTATVDPSSTQVVISYTAPDLSACALDVRESGASDVVNDVNPDLFFGSDSDTRATSVNSGRFRVVVVGKRSADVALDLKRYSRALQTATLHTYEITCGLTVFSGSFTTVNNPVGQTHGDPPSGDPASPGQYAYPTVDWECRDCTYIDPKTGVLMIPLDTPRDAYESVGTNLFVAGTNVTSGWDTPNAIIADDSASATFTGTGSTSPWLFADLGLSFNFGTSSVHSDFTPSANSINLTLNAWGDSATLSARQLELALTVDGVSPASNLVTVSPALCVSSCLGAGNRFDVFSAPLLSLLGDWFASNAGQSTIDTTMLSKRSGTVTRATTTVTWVSGDTFCLCWRSGSAIVVNSISYLISSVDNDKAITLQSGSGSDASPVAYVGSNAGVLIRKKSTSADLVSVQFVSYAYEVGDAPGWQDAGDEDWTETLSPGTTNNTLGEVGRHVYMAGMFYWVGPTTLKRNRLGRAVIPFNGGSPGWNTQQCRGGYWSNSNPDVFYCVVSNNVEVSSTMHFFDQIVVKVQYFGDNRDIGALAVTQPLVTCTGMNQPCFTFTLLTLVNSLNALIATNAEYQRAQFGRINTLTISGRLSNSDKLVFMARRDEVNDTMAFMFIFDPSNGTMTASRSSYHDSPIRWAANHGPFNLNDPATAYIAATYYRGPISGNDTAAGNGPYYSTITSGAVSATPGLCPLRPIGSPIPLSDWPILFHCTDVTVDGDPGDPSPKYYTVTVAVSGTSMTSSGAFVPQMDGRQVKLASASPPYPTMTYIDVNTATLSSSTTFSGTATIYAEPVDCANVGNPDFSCLQAAEVGDIVAMSSTPTDSVTPGSGTYIDQNQYAGQANVAERARIIKISGNVWTLQRGYAGIYSYSGTNALLAGGILSAQPTTCSYGPLTTGAPCVASEAYWNTVTGVGSVDILNLGCCHATEQSVQAALSARTCPSFGGNNAWCMFARGETLSGGRLHDSGAITSYSGPFHGIIGIATPNNVDSHPGSGEYQVPSTEPEAKLYYDARPLLGALATSWFGSAGSPGTVVAGTLYRFTSSQYTNLHPRTMPSIAACGSNALLDISAAASHIVSTAGDNYKWCYANAIGECRNGGDTGGTSAAGDVFVNCPQISDPYCAPLGIGTANPDLRDICIGDLGSAAIQITQNSAAKVDIQGSGSRRLTNGFTRYRFLPTFWNPKVSPDGRLIFFQAPWVNGLRDSVWMAKIPAYPAPDGLNHGDYVPVSVKVPTVASASTAVVQFGYDPNYFCTSRQEICVAANSTSPEFYWAGETFTRVSCSAGCTITVPGISQLALYWRILVYDGGGSVISTIQMYPKIVP